MFGRRMAALHPDVVIDLILPDHGLGVLHHVHADDVAQAFELALSRRAAIGNSFHVVAEQAMTQRGLAAGVARWFGRAGGDGRGEAVPAARRAPFTGPRVAAGATGTIVDVWAHRAVLKRPFPVLTAYSKVSMKACVTT
jgi:nucleoside-diphosphate-sugar epimerase